MPGMPGPGSNAPDVPLDLDLPVLDDLMLETTDESSESAEPQEGSPEPAPEAEEPASSEPEAEVTE